MRLFSEKYLYYSFFAFGMIIFCIILIFYFMAVFEQVPDNEKDIPNYPPVLLKKFLYKPEKFDHQKMFEYSEQVIRDISKIKPERTHFFGTDNEGADILSKIILGTKMYFMPIIIVVLIAITGGIFIGSYCGFYDNAIKDILDNLLGFLSGAPKYIIFLLAIVLYGKPNINIIMILLGLFSIPKLAILIRTKINFLKKEGFIEAGRDLGFSDIILIVKHMLFYHCLIIVFINILFIIADVILVETTLNYLGIIRTEITSHSMNMMISVNSWGTMISDGFDVIKKGYYWVSFFPALTIILFITGLVFLGESLQHLHNEFTKN